ncbi:MAG: response regulator transcription factor [Anaerolineaceae bacterium]|nr:response regulator transcription factor [Anaerolineaceae bacterium]
MDAFIEPQAFVSGPRVMIVCDDPEAAAVWDFILKQSGIQTILECAYQDALARWVEEITDLVVIDISAGHKECLQLCEELRTNTVAPILLFMPAYHEDQLLEAYHAGVDECLVKPVSPALFTAKVKAWLRRIWTVPVNGLEKVQSSKLELDPNRRAVVTRDGEVIRLTNLEFRFLHLLMSQPGAIFKTGQIVQSVWGAYGHGDSVLIKNVVYRLRRKIEDDPGQPCLILNWPGEGYSFQGG